ncbi:MAG: murein biosynthesis integral membrane protein MurJ [Chloroflexi bacterium]|nr:murein biosynthesis integral membrane protein MurJ [Chloroflexota bacterium]
MSLFVLSRVLGLVRQMVVGAMFGTGDHLDAYMAAARVPEAIFLIVAGGALGSALIPTFSTHIARGDTRGAWRLASAIVNLVLAAMTILALLIAIIAPTIVRTLIAPGFSTAQQARTTDLLRVMLLSPIIFGASGVVMAVLNAQQHFFLPALAPAIYNVGIIGGAVLLGPRMGVMGLAAGSIVGAVLHLLVQIPGLARYGAVYAPTFGLREPSVRVVGRLMAPRVIGTAITQVNLMINNSLASHMGEGAVSTINYAWLLMALPEGVLAQAVGTAAFPTFADQVARGQLDEMRETLAATLRTVFFLSLPATVGLLMLSRPLVGVLFERGAFQATSTTSVAWALAFYALGLVGHAGLEVIARAFYALHDTFTPVWVGAVAVVTNVTLSLTLPGLFEIVGWPNFAGLALANAVATLAEMGLLLVLIWRRMHGIEARRLANTSAKSGVAALVMGLALVLWQVALPEASSLVLAVGGTALGIAVYMGVALLLRAEEPLRLLDVLHR